MKEYIIQVKVNNDWYLLLACGKRPVEEVQKTLDQVSKGEYITWCRQQYPTNEFRIAEIGSKDAWWNDPRNF